MQLIITEEDGSATLIDVNEVNAGFAGLIEQFDRDPVTGVDLRDAAHPDAITQIIAAGWGGSLCGAMTAATAQILRRYPDRPSGSIDDHMARLGLTLEQPEFSSETVEIANMLVQEAITAEAAGGEARADQTDAVLEGSFAVAQITDPMAVLQVMKATLALCCATVAVAQGR